MAVLYCFFSMPTKLAAQNSLYIILISQVTGLIKTLLSGAVPQINIWILAGMTACGVIGSEMGGRINRKLDEKKAIILFECLLVLVLCINIYNMTKFF